MRQSKLFGKTIREAPKDEVSANAIFLSRAGYIDKLIAGVYNYLPLGVKVLSKIQNIVREEMNKIDGQEIYLSALQHKELWEKTGRWQSMKEIMFQFEGRGNQEIGLGATHEEPITSMVKKRVSSYRDLPFYLYQIQDKFRNEPRAKSGLLRGREFNMKDLYSFCESQEDLNKFYDRAIKAYLTIFERCGLKAIVTEASGGDFSKEYSHEFQVLTKNGEDNIVICTKCDFAQNSEICKLKDGDECPKCKAKVKHEKSIEVGNIFKLGTKFSHDLGLKFKDKSGKEQEVIMGSYGIGPSRVMGSVAEVYHDEKGLIWPKSLSPFAIHLLLLSEDDKKKQIADKLYDDLIKQGIDILYDDREVSAGVKLNDADLIGVSLQLIIGDKTKDKVEYKIRAGNKKGEVDEKDIKKLL
ncbi:hypothetical protein HN800_02970 [bacterium]|jgi:prolyl-tRNA synthetase|nr:hypothetical protein [bacterium]MBT4334989.1 hypothetical protein [bacterium]MBT4496048.1 hypothetical protein [bacterium]MBT4764023.1 hypothetical protein [bacterium]MBT5401395.1 hypothetical protein [bacterium]